MTEYYVPTGMAESELVEKRSRFIGHVFPVGSETEAKARIEEMKKKYHDARHNCWCYRLKDGLERCSDDGEPQGTAGQPILNVFQREAVTDVCCVVTRYFGGVLLGAGGLVRALRTIPMFVEIAEAIKQYCPETMVINYTNPMTLCVKTLYEVFPEIKAFGCCHEVFGTQKILRDLYQMATGEEHVGREEVIVNVQGINHFTWFDRASCRGVDLFPVYRKFIDEHFEDGYHDPDRNWMNGTFNCAHRVKMDLFNRYGAIAAAGDRHLAEFMPGDTYLKDPNQVHDWKFALTTVEWRKERQAEKNQQAKRLAAGQEELELAATGEEGILLMKALCGLNRMVSNVNIPNTSGQIPNLPRTAVVETNAVFYKGTIQPIFAGEMKPEIAALIMPHVKNHERILKAAMTPDFQLAFEAFMDVPLIKGRISEEDGRSLLKEMIANTLDVLPEEWKGQILLQ